MFRGFQLTPELIAWHEAGHIVARDYYGLPWVKASINPVSLTGQVRYSTGEAICWPVDDVGLVGVFGVDPAFRAVSWRYAVIAYAGVAAELLCLRRPFDQNYFDCGVFDDFVTARRMLRLTDCEDWWPSCAEFAYDIVALHRGAIERLSALLLADGAIEARR